LYLNIVAKMSFFGKGRLTPGNSHKEHKEEERREKGRGKRGSRE
jgi:hypothetical protein